MIFREAHVVFDAYSRYYDAIYREKDYVGEYKYINHLLNRFHKKPKSVIEFGCGTGKYTQLFANDCDRITGVDLSPSMVDAAMTSLGTVRPRAQVDFVVGDLCTYRPRDKFDAAVCLFHVIDYIVDNRSLDQAFASIGALLKPGGVFMFDFWHGPTILADPPIPRIKQVETEDARITRISQSKLFPCDNVVSVNFQILVEDRTAKQVETFSETHRMRYFFIPEIQQLCERNGLSLMHFEEWGTGNPLGLNTRYGVCVCEKKD
jgi:SAM-dependent methyltransferase